MVLGIDQTSTSLTSFLPCSVQRPAEMVHLTISVFLLVATVLMDGPTAVSASSPTPSAHSEAVLIEAAQRHADPELEALLPTTLGGVALTIESQSGTDLTTRSAPF